MIITIIVTKDENQYIAECKSLGTFGGGNSAVNALLDLAEFMKDDYELLLKYKDRLTNCAQNKLNQYEFKEGKKNNKDKRGGG